MDERSRQEKYAYLKQLSTSDLEAILRADAESPESGDADMILYITEVMIQREQENPTGRLCDVAEAWEEFQTYYNIPEGEGLSLYPMSDPEDDVNPADSKAHAVEPVAAVKSEPPAHRSNRVVLRRVLPIAAVVALLLVALVTAQAVGFDIFGTFAKWSDDTFRFAAPQNRYVGRSADSEEDKPGADAQELQDVFQDALNQCGITEALAPAWFPDGCEQDGELTLSFTDYLNKISCKYKVEDRYYLIVTIQHYDNEVMPDVTATEKDADPVECYLANGRLFYIMSNNDSLNAAWSDGQNLSVVVSGDIPIQDLKQFLNSMGA